MQTFRAIYIATVFLAFTLPLMPLQWLFVVFDLPFKRTFPHWYHKNVCRIMGIRLHQSGKVLADKPVLLVANHTSWLDITVLSAVAPVSFVAKKEVASWPFFSWLAKLQRSIFVDRTRRTAAGRTKGAIAERLTQGDKVILFAEGTSSDGNQVLPFKSALFAAAENSDADSEVSVQTIAVAYTRRNGLPLGRKNRPHVAWYGDMDLMSHLWNIFKGGPLDVNIHIREPVALQSLKNRKELATFTENAIRHDVAMLLRAKQLSQSQTV